MPPPSQTQIAGGNYFYKNEGKINSEPLSNSSNESVSPSSPSSSASKKISNAIPEAVISGPWRLLIRKCQNLGEGTVIDGINNEFEHPHPYTGYPTTILDSTMELSANRNDEHLLLIQKPSKKCCIRNDNLSNSFHQQCMPSDAMNFVDKQNQQKSCSKGCRSTGDDDRQWLLGLPPNCIGSAISNDSGTNFSAKNVHKKRSEKIMTKTLNFLMERVPVHLCSVLNKRPVRAFVSVVLICILMAAVPMALLFYIFPILVDGRTSTFFGWNTQTPSDALLDDANTFKAIPLDLTFGLSQAGLGPITDMTHPLRTLLKRGGPTAGHNETVWTCANSTKGRVDVYEGQRPVASKNHWLGSFEINGLPVSCRYIVRVQVAAKMDPDTGFLILYAAFRAANGNMVFRGPYQIDYEKRRAKDPQKIAEHLVASKKWAEWDSVELWFWLERARFFAIVDRTMEMFEELDKNASKASVAAAAAITPSIQRNNDHSGASNKENDKYDRSKDDHGLLVSNLCRAFGGEWRRRRRQTIGSGTDQTSKQHLIGLDELCERFRKGLNSQRPHKLPVPKVPAVMGLNSQRPHKLPVPKVPTVMRDYSRRAGRFKFMRLFDTSWSESPSQSNVSSNNAGQWPTTALDGSWRSRRRAVTEVALERVRQKRMMYFPSSMGQEMDLSRHELTVLRNYCARILARKYRFRPNVVSVCRELEPLIMAQLVELDGRDGRDNSIRSTSPPFRMKPTSTARHNQNNSTVQNWPEKNATQEVTPLPTEYSGNRTISNGRTAYPVVNNSTISIAHITENGPSEENGTPESMDPLQSSSKRNRAPSDTMPAFPGNGKEAPNDDWTNIEYNDRNKVEDMARQASHYQRLLIRFVQQMDRIAPYLDWMRLYGLYKVELALSDVQLIVFLQYTCTFR